MIRGFYIVNQTRLTLGILMYVVTVETVSGVVSVYRVNETERETAK